jgi:HK97 family phage prohead protease
MYRFYAGGLEPLGERQVGIVASTARLGRDNLIVEPAGIDLAPYRKNPICLWQHDPECPVGVATAIGVRENALMARIDFAPAGISALADQVCSLVKAGVVKGISIGFETREAEPIDPKDRRAGLRIKSSELMEISFVSIPADTGAVVVERTAAHLGAVAFATLHPVPPAAVQRAAARVPHSRGGQIMSHAGHVWALLEARRQEQEERFGHAARQADLRRLSGARLN